MFEVVQVVDAQPEDFELLLDDLEEHIALKSNEVVVDNIPRTVQLSH